jgi:protein SCO1/2
MVLHRALGAAMALLLSGLSWAQPAPLKGVELRDQQGRPLRAGSLRGQVVLLHFVFTGCSTTCPIQVRELAALHEALPPAVREQVRFVSISLDPHDTPAALSAFARRLAADRAGWQFASGPAADIDRIAERLQAYDPRQSKPALGDHRTSLYVYDRRGELLQRYAGVPVDRARLQRELTQTVSLPRHLANGSPP